MHSLRVENEICGRRERIHPFHKGGMHKCIPYGQKTKFVSVGNRFIRSANVETPCAGGTGCSLRYCRISPFLTWLIFSMAVSTVS